MVRSALLAIACLAGCGRLGFDERLADGGAPGPGADARDASSGSASGDASVGSFGTMTVGISTQNSAPDRVWMSKFTLTETAQVQELVAYFAGPSNVRGVIYSDASGSPTSLLATTNIVAAPSQAGWVTLPLATPLMLSPGTYWIGTHNASQIGIAYQSATGASKFNNDLFSDGADATWGGGATTYSLQLSIYANYTR